MKYQTTIYFWRKHKGSLHLQSVLVASDDDSDFSSRLITTLNKISEDPEKLSMADGFLAMMSAQVKLTGYSPLPGASLKTENDTGTPVCPVHDKEMSISKYPSKGADITWFCPNRDGGDYCNQRADDTPRGRRRYEAKPRR